MTATPTTLSQKRYAGVLGVLLLLFVGRVLAHLLQTLHPVTFLPDVTAWHSGVLPYPLLLPTQFLLIAIMGTVVFRMRSGKIRPRPAAGNALLSLGCLYLSLAIFRLASVFTFGAGHAFLGALIPSIFHVALSSWFVTLGLYHYLESRSHNPDAPSERALSSLVPWLIYPMIMVGALWLHTYLKSLGLALLWATYLPVAAGALLITVLERFQSHRPGWRPDQKEVKADLAFMIFVQILLPRLLAFFLAVSALRWLQARDLSLDGFWPHDMPALLQAGLMILIADFFRYWLHRASHEWSPRLWNLHAVHHSPQKLYWFNVGRFHPLEKGLQFLCDAAPFLLLGISETVLALYFLFYALNGFLQHSNIRIHLGWLNCLISGPELHRWHHSWEVRESNKNYGNNLIVWDLLFGSYFLPKDREVEDLGLKNRNYPGSFLSQMKTPFHPGLDQEKGRTP